MKDQFVRDYMVSLEEYARVRLSDTVYEAALALKEKKNEAGQFKHTTVLVMNDQDEFESRVSILDLMEGLEPKYGELEKLDLDRFGFSREFLKNWIKDYNLWQHSIEDICRFLPKISISKVVKKNDPSEFIEADATLDLAIHQMIMTRNHSLLVREKGRVIGILRSIDFFKLFINKLELCST